VVEDENDTAPSNTTGNASESAENKTDDVEIKEEVKKEKKKKTIEETVWKWNLINKNKAIWLRNKDNITTEEYHDFYKALTNDYEKPIAYSHIKAEGEMEFKSILYIPEHAPYDMFENYYSKKSSIKLFVKRVMVTDEFEEFLPRYLSFVRGVLDSDDLPLNVGREQLQQLKILKVISKKLVRKAIDMITGLNDQEEEEEEADEEVEVDEEESTQENKTTADKTAIYEKFWKEFGKNIKLGVVEDAPNRNKLSKLLRYVLHYIFVMTLRIRGCLCSGIMNPSGSRIAL
jgi:heat shock protein beta